MGRHPHSQPARGRWPGAPRVACSLWCCAVWLFVKCMAAGGVFAASGTWQAEVKLREGGDSAAEQRLFLVAGSRSGLAARIALHHTLGSGIAGEGPWGASVVAERGPLEVRLFWDEDHVTSSDPFRLVHKSARSPGAAAGQVRWRGPWGGWL
ncbi:MAG: hypothetical protein H0Z37_10300, partial [Firmicutes bacterium]|nr:hypothetical protein [Bacillota bacterium]